MNQNLLEQAQPYCDANTGEVLQRMPEELMQQLRAAKLAIGVAGKPSPQTGTTATWFVFLTDGIRERAMAMYHQGKQKRPLPPQQDVGKESSRGLDEFLDKRQLAK